MPPPEASSLAGEGQKQAHAGEGLLGGSTPTTQGSREPEVPGDSTWANGGPKMHTSHLRKGFPD